MVSSRIECGVGGVREVNDGLHACLTASENCGVAGFCGVFFCNVQEVGALWEL